MHMNPQLDLLRDGSELAEHAQTAMSKRFRWLVLYTRPRYEKKVSRQLTERGIEHFLPLREEMRQWSDRKKLVEAPLFPGYIFVRVDERQRIQTLETDGAMKYIHFNGRVAEVRPSVIDNLRLLLTRPEGVRVEDAGLRIGQRVTVKHGPLAGLEGTLITHRGPMRIGVLVDVIDQVVTIEIPVGDLDVTTEARETNGYGS